MNPTRRKLAIATWSAPREGNIYGRLTLDATNALAHVAHLRETTGEKVTIGHLVGKAIALALKAAPGLNGRILFGRFIPHDTVDITFLVSLDEGADLAKTRLERVDEMKLPEIARSLRERAERLRAGRDDEFEKNKGVLRALPTWLLRPLLFLTGWLAGALGVNIKALGVQRFAFGSAVITNVGVFGLDEGFAPPTPFARVPLLVLVGAVSDRPAVVDGQVVVRPQLTITATIDHRFIDGAQIAVLAKTMRAVFDDPTRLD